MKKLFTIFLCLLLVTPPCSASLTSKVVIKITGTFTRSLDQQTVSAPVSYTKTFSWTDGNGADQAQQVFTDDRTLAASATEDLDLAASLSNGFGQTITFTKIRAIYIEAASGNTNNVNVGGAAANQFSTCFSDTSDVAVVRPGSAILLVARDATGFTVTAGTGDLLKVANSGAGTSVTYTIILIGAGSAS